MDIIIIINLFIYEKRHFNMITKQIVNTIDNLKIKLEIAYNLHHDEFISLRFKI